MGLLPQLSNAIIMLNDQSSASSYLPAITTPNSQLFDLTIVVSEQALARTIEELGAWSYGAHGEYSRIINIQAHAWDIEPSVNIVGGVLDDVFISRLEQEEGYVLLPVEASELIRLEQNSLNSEKCLWQSYKTPHARFLERLRRDIMDEVPSEMSAFMVKKIVHYETLGTEDHISQTDAWNEVKSEVAPEVRRIFGEEVSREIFTNLEYYKLSES